MTVQISTQATLSLRMGPFVLQTDPVGILVLKKQLETISGSLVDDKASDEFFPDIALVTGVRAANQVAIAQLFDRHERHIHNILFHILGGEPEVLDILHDVFVTAIESIQRLKNPIALRAWLSGIAVFKAKTFIRRRRFARLLGTRDWYDVPVPSTLPGPEISAALRAAYSVLDRLPSDERIPFVLRMVQGLHLQEVAEACGISLATAKRKISAGNTRFRRLAQKHLLLRDWLQELKGEP